MFIMRNKLRKRKRKNKKPKRQKKKPIVKNILVSSSLIFITNIITAFIYNYYVYSCLLFFLTLTSVTYHTNTNKYTNILDKIGIFLVVSYGIYTFSTKFTINNFIVIALVVVLFVAAQFIYIFGYYTKQFCFHTELCIGNKYHSLLHCISSLAHHLIVLM